MADFHSESIQALEVPWVVVGIQEGSLGENLNASIQ